MRVTRYPALASAAPDESPARPPPITITLFDDIRLRPRAQLRASKDAKFFGGAQANPRRKNIVAARFDPREQTAVGPRQTPKRGAAIPIHQSDQRGAILIEAPGAIGFKRHQFRQSRSERTGQLFLGNTELFEVLLRQIHPAEAQIFRQIAQDIRQLKGDAETFGEVGGAVIAKAKDVDAREPHGAGDAVAILPQTVERWIGSHDQ